ncbi:MAG: bifunctional UDP-3-O-[3-hydroxymyristoyl] N-acetylglucosamine deacetylase/3-hydroxyacyl-ACP dehydratase [Bacteroidales bacterium]|nr:bifunctional UDP-3-O-[3-hydroxymyristoyl] N-acetylglucosamine deacetylase/3-hydroxyacyl-ACP dehydratase [Bacteroidales bacterium]
MLITQRTLKQSYTFKGKGLHTGVQVTMFITPAPENHGVKFKRSDLDGEPIIDAITDYVSHSLRNTTLVKGAVSVATTEHILAALYALGVDNALITLDGPEVPILDGSSKPYTDAILADGLEDQESERRVFEVKEKIVVKDDESGAELAIYPDDEFSAEVMIDFNSKVLGHQFARYKADTNFASEIAPCRTFVFFHELEPLFKNNLIKGGDLNNAIVVVENEVPQEELDRLASLFNSDKLGRGKSGYLNHLNLHFENECARHKLLDVIGDIALSGFYFKGKIIANKPGHKINTKLASLLRKAAKDYFSKPVAPKFDLNSEPLVDINGIKNLLPHRPPFLMVDRIIEMTPHHVVGVKTIGVNEAYFLGHFPDEPVMPGVLIIEAMAQVGGILVLSELEEPEKYSTYFAKIDGVKFKKKVVPGDVLVIKLTLTAPLRRSIVCMKGEAFVGDTLVCEGEMVAQVIKNK